jgi:DNA helicase-2/ATP-dependent DNA helicase PcrA
MAAGSEEEIEEELRLTYVAMTRARDFLYVTWPLRYYFKWYALTDGHTYAQRCRFFTDEVISTMDETHLEYEPGDDMVADIDAGINVSRNISRMWDAYN